MTDDLRHQIEMDIERARAGGLPQKWQASCFGSLNSAEKDGSLPKSEADALRDRLRRAISSCSQISDREFAQNNAAQNGGTLLYYYDSPDAQTEMSITAYPDGYTAVIFLDACASNDLAGYAEAMRKDLLAWATRQGKQAAAMPSKRCLPEDMIVRHKTLEEALGYLLAMLDAPEHCLC